jgi:hypothetical protein
MNVPFLRDSYRSDVTHEIHPYRALLPEQKKAALDALPQ